MYQGSHAMLKGLFGQAHHFEGIEFSFKFSIDFHGHQKVLSLFSTMWHPSPNFIVPVSNDTFGCEHVIPTSICSGDTKWTTGLEPCQVRKMSPNCAWTFPKVAKSSEKKNHCYLPSSPMPFLTLFQQEVRRQVYLGSYSRIRLWAYRGGELWRWEYYPKLGMAWDQVFCRLVEKFFDFLTWRTSKWRLVLLLKSLSKYSPFSESTQN